MPRRGAADLPDYRIFETDEFRRKLEKLSVGDRETVGSKLNDYAFPSLREQPHFGVNIRKLRGYLPETWRYRIGRFRVFYSIDEEERTVYVLTIEARKNAYR